MSEKSKKLSVPEIDSLSGRNWAVLIMMVIGSSYVDSGAERKAFEAKLSELSSASFVGHTKHHDQTLAIAKVMVEGRPLPAIYHALELTWQSLESTHIEEFRFDSFKLGDQETHDALREADPAADLEYFDVTAAAYAAVTAVGYIRLANNISDFPEFSIS